MRPLAAPALAGVPLSGVETEVAPRGPVPRLPVLVPVVPRADACVHKKHTQQLSDGRRLRVCALACVCVCVRVCVRLGGAHGAGRECVCVRVPAGAHERRVRRFGYLKNRPPTYHNGL